MEQNEIDKKRIISETRWWFAACKAGHPIWDGRAHDNYEDAESDAVKHDKEVHADVKTAVVYSC